MPYRIRSATRNDSLALAHLIIQLAHTETPGLLRGPLDRQSSLVRYMLEYNDGADIHGRFVIEDTQQILGTAALHLPGMPPPAFPRFAVMAMAITLLGYRASIHLFTDIGLNMLAAHFATPPRPSNSAYLYGVSVDSLYRRQGIGRLLINHSETVAYSQASPLIHLRVIKSNQQAITFYQHLGYRIVGQTPQWIGQFPSLILQKRLDSEARPVNQKQ